MTLNTNIKILVVDDFKTMRKIIKNILTHPSTREPTQSYL